MAATIRLSQFLFIDEVAKGIDFRALTSDGICEKVVTLHYWKDAEGNHFYLLDETGEELCELVIRLDGVTKLVLVDKTNDKSEQNQFFLKLKWEGDTLGGKYKRRFGTLFFFRKLHVLPESEEKKDWRGIGRTIDVYSVSSSSIPVWIE